MITVQKIAEALEEFAPLTLQESYDNSGLLVGNPADTVDGVLLSLDITEKTIQEAILKGANMVISHHPLIFSAIKRITNSTDSQRAIRLAIQNNISIYACHTNIDKAEGGVSYRMGEKLGLKKMTPLVAESAPCKRAGDGLGVIGFLEEPTDSLTFLNFVKKTFGCPTIRHTALTTNKIRCVSLCGGSGAPFLDIAMQRGADIYISADFKYHNFFSAENSIIIADIGHFESERYTIEIFYEILTKKFINFAPHISEQVCNPVIYL